MLWCTGVIWGDSRAPQIAFWALYDRLPFTGVGLFDSRAPICLYVKKSGFFMVEGDKLIIFVGSRL